MTLLRRVRQLSALLLGLIGLLGCLAAAAGIWVVYDRVRITTNAVFAKMDDAFDGVGERIGRTQSRVEESKINTEAVRQAAAEWSRQEARDRVAATRRVRERSQRLSESLAKADEYLAVSESSAELESIQEVPLT